MQLQAQETRHTVLLFLIVIVLPLIFYPKNFGVGFDISPILWMILEFLYFGVVLWTINDDPTAKGLSYSLMICFGFRLCAGVGFALLLVLMNGISVGTAFASGLSSYKPAVLLHTLSAPFIMLTILRPLLGMSRQKVKSRFSITPLSESSLTESIQPEQVRHEPEYVSKNPLRGRVIPMQPAVDTFESSPKSFDHAVEHVFELSAVRFCVLLDTEGLPVAYAGDELVHRDVWAPIGRLLSEQVQSTLLRAGNLVLQGFDLSLDTYRLHSVQVCGMWLLVGADRQSEELEKVRISQAVEMIKKTFETKYPDASFQRVPEEYYV
ncbi:MAG: hypothetical protein KKG33_07575 [candidate division Zixibacteria bacterium]|nr:hypothetical protein [candidate division Zixibacteria bacterium]MBU1471699.1 hypothetical protein [candidate division Zixibacteria bacterium]MBU2625405.1 hypothetical protein [candidate division Zixibacteria bacterium]